MVVWERDLVWDWVSVRVRGGKKEIKEEEREMSRMGIGRATNKK